jgi:hypothetical protein
MPQPALVDDGSHLLTNNMIMLVYNIEQLIWHIEEFPLTGEVRK